MCYAPHETGCVKRFLLSLLALCALSSVPLRASDIYDITLTGNPGSPSGSGMFTTDGTCVSCRPGSGLLDLTINIDRDNGAAAFDISDDMNITLYFRPTNTLSYEAAVNSETGDHLDMIGGTWNMLLGTMANSGTYSITPVPEPRSLFLLMPIVALGGLRWRHQRALRGV